MGNSIYRITKAGSGTSLIKLSKSSNTSLKSLTAGSGIVIVDDGAGNLTFSSTGGGGSVNQTKGAVGLSMNGNGVAIPTGIMGDVIMPYSGTITAVQMLADQAGNAVVDVWKTSTAGFPPTSANTITASDRPTLSASASSYDSTLTGWTTAVSAGDILRFNVVAASVITRLQLELFITKS